MNKMRNVSKDGEWTEWCIFFLDALAIQAKNNVIITEQIEAFYDEMLIIFRDVLASKWHKDALDFIMETPIFLAHQLTLQTEIKNQTALRFIKQLIQHELLEVIEPPAGRRTGVYKFEPFLKLIPS